MSPSGGGAVASRFTFQPPTASGVSSALESAAGVVNPLRRTRSLAAATDDQPDDEADDRNRRKKAKGDAIGLTVGVTSASASGDHGDMSDEDDFFTSMDPSAADLRPVSGRVAASTFFKALDEHKEAARAARDASTAAATSDDKYAVLAFNEPPLDWNIHGKIRFTSTEPFNWIEEHSVEVSGQRRPEGGGTQCV